MLETSTPLIASSTKASLEQAVVRLAHSTLIVGGATQNHVAVGEWFALQAQRHHSAEVQVIDSSSGNLETVKELRRLASVRHTSPLIVLVQQTDSLSLEAQSALLKSIEEPSTNTFFVLTVSNTTAILDTILSRSMVQQLAQVSLEETTAHFKSHDSTEVQRAYQASLGNVVHLQAYLAGERDSLERAKKVLALPTYERLGLMDEILTSDDEANTLVALRSILTYKLEQNPSERNIQALEQCLEAEQMLHNKAHPKLLLTHLFAAI